MQAGQGGCVCPVPRLAGSPMLAQVPGSLIVRWRSFQQTLGGGRGRRRAELAEDLGSRRPPGWSSAKALGLVRRVFDAHGLQSEADRTLT